LRVLSEVRNSELIGGPAQARLRVMARPRPVFFEV